MTPRSLRRPSVCAALATLLAGSLLSGCLTLEPRYVRSTGEVAPSFPQGGAYAVEAAGPDASKVTWDAFFIDPKLKAVIGQALANNRDLRVAVANIAAARGRYRVQRADLFPTIAASGTAVYGHNGDYGYRPQGGTGTATGTGIATGGVATGGVSGGSVTSQTGDYREYSASLGVSSYEIDLFGRVRSLTKEALENYLSTAEAARAARVSLIAETASDYLTLAADRQRLKVAQDTLKADETIFQLTQARFTGGIASELDVRQAQTALEQARSDVATYTTTAAQDLDALTLVVGAPVGEDVLPQGLDGALPTVADAPTGLSSQVLLARPDVLEAEHTLKAYNADIGAARAAFFPTISLTASGGSSSLYLSKLFASGTGTYSIAPSIDLPIFDWGRRQGSLQLSKAERDSALASYEKAIQSAFKDVADALAQRGTVDALISSQERLTDAAAVSLKLSQARYTSGADTFLNTLDAQRTLYGAQQTLVSARATRALNIVELYRALGGGAG